MVYKGHKGRKTHRRKHTRRQTGGAGWGFSGPAFAASGGVQVENRGSYDHCYDDMRAAPAVGTPTLWGGSRKSHTRRRQRGGGCGGCGAPAQLMRGGGAGTGGYSLSYDNSLGKVYAEAVKAPCPTQAGGGSIYEHVAYPASYGYDTGSAYLSSSAHFLEPKADVTRCASGGSRRRKSRKHKKSHSKRR